jgi:hypothetical protein
VAYTYTCFVDPGSGGRDPEPDVGRGGEAPAGQPTQDLLQSR